MRSNGYESLRKLDTQPHDRAVFMGGFSEDGVFVEPFMEALSAIHENPEFVQLGTSPKKLKNIFDKPTTLYGHSGFWTLARELPGLPKQIIADDPLEPTKTRDMIACANALNNDGTILEHGVPKPKKINGAIAVARRPRQLNILSRGRKISTSTELAKLALDGEIEALMISYRKDGEFEFGQTPEATATLDKIKHSTDPVAWTAGVVEGTHNTMLLRPQDTLGNIGQTMGWFEL